MLTSAEKSTILVAAATAMAAAGFLAWAELRARTRRLPMGTPAGTQVTAPLTAPGAVAATQLPKTLTTARVNWVPLADADPVTQGQTYAFYDVLPAGITTKQQLLSALVAFGWSNVRIDAMPGEILPAWLPVKHGTDATRLFSARGTWSLMTAPARPPMMVAYRPGTPVAIKESQIATSLVHDSSSVVTIYTVTDGTWWWGSFVCVADGGRPIHPQAVGYTSGECVMKLQPILAHCAAPASGALPPMVAGGALG